MITGEDDDFEPVLLESLGDDDPESLGTTAADARLQSIGRGALLSFADFGDKGILVRTTEASRRVRVRGRDGFEGRGQDVEVETGRLSSDPLTPSSFDLSASGVANDDSDIDVDILPP